MPFKPAKRSQSRARIAIVGPSGSGKTYGALLLARGLVGPEGRIAVIDTEQGSAQLYSDLTPFYAETMTKPFSPARYSKAIEEAKEFDALLIDSLSHAWFAEGGVLDIVDVAAARSKHNKWAAWREGTPAHNELIQAMLQSPCHVIATMRSKTEWAVDQSGDKSKPQRIGMSPIQRDGTEYEFTTVFELDAAHQAIAVKDRTTLFDGWRGLLSVHVGEKYRAWLAGSESVAAPEPKPVPKPPPPPPNETMTHGPPPPTKSSSGVTRKDIGDTLTAMAGGDRSAAIALCRELLGVSSLKDLTDEQLDVSMATVTDAMAKRLAPAERGDER